jgi:hypothetical protein
LENTGEEKDRYKNSYSKEFIAEKGALFLVVQQQEHSILDFLSYPI